MPLDMNYLTSHDWGHLYRVSSPKEILENPAMWRSRMYRAKVLVIKGLADLSSEELLELHTVFGDPWSPEEYRDSNEKVELTESGGGCVTSYGNLITKSIGNLAMPWHRDIPWHREKRYPIRSLYPTQLSMGAGSAGTEFADCDILFKRLRPADLDLLHRTKLLIQNWYQVQANHSEPDLKTIPLVERHPVTGLNSILLNSFRHLTYGFTRCGVGNKGAWTVGVQIDGEAMPYAEAHEWLDYLHSLVATHDNIYTHQWELGDLVLFDNFSGVFHRRDAIEAPEGAERRFWRINLKHRLESA